MASLIQRISSIVVILGLAVVNNPAQALPGDGMEAAIKRISENELIRGKKFQQQSRYGVTSSTTSIKYGDATVTVQINSQMDFFKNLTEGIGTDDSSIYSAICQNLSRKDYNLKQESILQNLVKGVWGQPVENDFVNARFTDRRDESAFGYYRALYKGNRFGYAAQCSMSPQVARFGFTIYNLSDWEKIRRFSE